MTVTVSINVSNFSNSLAERSVTPGLYVVAYSYNWINVSNLRHFGGLFCMVYSHVYPPE